MTNSAAKPRRKRPIATHPWFPAALGTWCAAALGLSSLAVPPPLLERIVALSGIAAVMPAAAPPLGETARLLIVLALSSIGEIVGLVVGRSIARRAGRTPGARRARNSHPDAPLRKPLLASEDIVLPDRADEPDGEDSELGGSHSPHLSDEETLVEFSPGGFALADSDERPRVEPEGREPSFHALIGATPVPPASEALVATIALADLGVVQLSERLAIALQARRERGFGPPHGAVVPPSLIARSLGTLPSAESASQGALTWSQRISSAR